MPAVAQESDMAKRRSLKCPECDRKFSMAGHLGRHMSAMHGVGGTKAKKKTTRRGKRHGKRGGRPKGMASSFGLRDLSLDGLSEVISSALREGRRRIAEFRKAMS